MSAPATDGKDEGPWWCYPCSKGEHADCTGTAWHVGIPCECDHSEAAER